MHMHQDILCIMHTKFVIKKTAGVCRKLENLKHSNSTQFCFCILPKYRNFPEINENFLENLRNQSMEMVQVLQCDGSVVKVEHPYTLSPNTHSLNLLH